MRVRFDGAWLSLVERSVRDREVVSSNLIAPILCIENLGELKGSPFVLLWSSFPFTSPVKYQLAVILR
jgi:hypothetical protein